MFGLIAAIVAAIAGSVTSAIGASSQRKAANRAMESEKQAAAIKAKQLRVQNDAKVAEVIKQQRAIRGRAVAVAADSGFGIGSDDFGSLTNEIDLNAGLNVERLDQNLYNDLRYLDSQLQASLDRLNSSKPDVFSSSLVGGLQMGATGLALGSGLSDLFTNPAAVEAVGPDSSINSLMGSGEPLDPFTSMTTAGVL